MFDLLPTRRSILAALALSAIAAAFTGCNNQPIRLRVVTYNIHHGEGMDGEFDLDRIASVINSLDPDLVALQEVDRKTERSGGVDQGALLASLTGMELVYGPAMEYKGGQYGDAILSRLPILDSAVHQLPQEDGSEPRVAVEAQVEIKKLGTLVLLSTHYAHDSATDRLAQARASNLLMAGREVRPAILAGDLNAEPGSEPMAALLTMWEDTTANRPVNTFPANRPVRKIDYILVNPPGRWTVHDVQVSGRPYASDHAPLLVELEWVRND